MASVPYFAGVKMTMHIDNDILAEVMALTGASSKTQAVEIALRDLARRQKLKRVLSAGLGLKPDELHTLFDGHPEEAGPTAALMVAEPPAKHGTSSTP